MPAAGQAKVRPLQGGTRTAATVDGKVLDGTLGLVIVVANGVPHFATAGHAVGEAGTTVGQPDPDVVVGRVVDNFLTSGADIAVVKVAAGVQAAAGQVWTGPGTHVTATFGATERPKAGDQVTLQGVTSGAVIGTVRDPDATIDGPNGQKLDNVVTVDYGTPTAPGDSGGPVLAGLTNGALCYGVHGGTFVSKGKPMGWFTPFDNIEWALLTP